MGAVTRRLRPDASVFALNPKAFGFKGFSACEAAFPPSKFSIRHLWLYRDSRDVIESFGSIMFAEKAPPAASDTLPATACSAELVARLKSASVDKNLAPKQSDFNKSMAFDWADQYLFAAERMKSSLSSGLESNIRSVGFPAFTSKDGDERRATLGFLFDFIGLPRAALGVALETFNQHSQKGSKMEKSSAVTKRKFLTDEGRAEIATWVEHLCGVEPDVQWPNAIEHLALKRALETD